MLELLLVPGPGDEWVYRRDERVRLPWSGAHHLVDGVTYVRPEIALLFKAKTDRPKDRADLEAARLSSEGRAWLVARLREEGRRAWADLVAQETRWRDQHLLLDLGDATVGPSGLGIVARRLSQTEALLYQQWIDNDRQLRATTAVQRAPCRLRRPELRRRRGRPRPAGS